MAEISEEAMREAYALGAKAAEINGTYDYGGASQVSIDAAAPLIFAAGVQAGREAAARETPAYVFDLIDAWQTGRPLDFHGHPVPDDVQARLARGTHQEGGQQ